MAARVQVSLNFEDMNLFDNFVTPFKEGRALNSLIIKCLSVYFYNEDIRNLIEGTSIEDTSEEKKAQEHQKLCDDIQASLLIREFVSSNLQNIIALSTEDNKNEVSKPGVEKPKQKETWLFDDDIELF